MKPTLFFLLASSLTVTSCLKDKDYEDGKFQSLRSRGEQRVVEMGLTATSNVNYLNIALDATPDDTTFNLIPIILASANPAQEDIKVTVVLNPALIGEYNATSDPQTNHGEAPASLYTIENPAAAGGGYVVTIPRGSNTGFLRIKLVPEDYLGFDYALGFQISKIEPSSYLVSSNLGTGVVAIGIKNEWDGIYDIKGYALRAGDPALTGNFTDREMALVTSGATSVAFGSLALWGDGNSLIAIGNPNLAINTAVGPPHPVTITSPGGASNAPGYNSRYEPATKTFFISFTWGAGPASRLATDTLTYNRPR